MLLALVLLTAVAWNRSAEYDEQYTLFLTAGTARPVWPDTAFPASLIIETQTGQAGFAAISSDLRLTDVHPPLYFWAAAAWRWAFGGGLFAVRMLSVCFGLGSLAAVGVIARRSGIVPWLAMLLTLGCYGFAYTAGIARGFALAEMLLLCGIACALAGHRGSAGALVGAAVLSNYLAVFVALAALYWRDLAKPVIPGFVPGTNTAWKAENCAYPGPQDKPGDDGSLGPSPPILARMERRGHQLIQPLSAWITFSPALLLAFWYFIAQKGSRTGQFPPFDVLSALNRIARYGAANLTGGLPLYVTDTARPFVTAILAIGLGLLLVRTMRAGRLLATAIATPLGLLALGVAFDNTPIELRYLSFSVPLAALLVTGSVHRRPWILSAILSVQTLSIAGLIARPETMQPAKATATAAAMAGADVVILPRGNDGIGIVGAFAREAPAAMKLLVIAPGETAEAIRTRVAPYHRIVLAPIAVDTDSQAAVPAMQAAFSAPGWHTVGFGSNVILYERVANGD